MSINNGKELESLVRLIQETLKDSPNTVIYSNLKLPNKSGRKREFDILIETKVNNLILKIAIECKDYKKPVSVEKIEAFQGKCERIPDINKKVFVSSKGYQIDAVNAAKEFGIDLYKIEDIDSSTVTNWFPIKQLGLQIFLKDFQFALIGSTEEIESLNNNLSTSTFLFKDEVIIDLNQFVFKYMKEYREEIWSTNIHEFMKTGGSKDAIGKKTNLPFKIEFKQNAYIENGDNLRIPVGEMTGTIDSWLVETKPKKIISKDFTTNDESQAKYVSFETEKHGKTEIILTSEREKFFYTDVNGIKTELKNLGTYDPKTDKFTLIK